MTKYAKCSVCGYVIAIPDDKNSSDYVCPNDGNTLTNATEDEFTIHLGGYTYIVEKLDSGGYRVVDCEGSVVFLETDPNHAENAIQYAIDNLNTGKVALDGEFKIADTVIIDKPVKLEGTSLASFTGGSVSAGLETYTPVGGTQISLIDGADCDMVKIESSGVIIKKLCFNGNRDNQTVGNIIHVTHQSPELVEVKIQHCQILNGKEAGILDKGWRTIVKDCFIGNCEYGVYAHEDGHMHPQVFDVWLMHNGYGIYGPATSDDRHFLVIGCSICYNRDQGILYGAQGANIIGNIIFLNGADGIKFVEPIDTSYYNVVGFNHIEKNGGSGVVLVSMTRCIGNGIDINTEDGIEIQGRSNIILGNVIIDNDRYGVHTTKTTAEGGRNNRVSHNLICLNTQNEIYAVDAVDFFTENTIGVKGVTVGSSVVMQRNSGYKTENSGTATITNGSSSVTVNHGLAKAPEHVFLTGTHTEVANCWVTNKTDTQFTINAPANVTADRDVYWEAEV